jgi:hypothetical protein
VPLREHRALTDVSYIPRLRYSIISLGQLDEHGCKTKVRRTGNILYLLDMKIEQPVSSSATQG